MRPILHLILTFSVTGLSVSAWGAVPQDKWEGYKPVEQAELPPQVRQFAENSVFYMQTVDATPAPGEKIEFVDPRNEKRITDPKTLRSDLRAIQIETCFKQKLYKCPIAKRVSKGTIFINNGKAYTCRHGFHNWLALAAMENNKSVSDITPPMIVSKPANGKSGKVVYNSAYDTMAEFSFINDSPELNVKYDESDPGSAGNNRAILISDFVVMAVPSLKNQPSLSTENLVLSTSRNEELFTFGYPGKTDFKALGEQNSAGLQLSATNGFVLGLYENQNTFYSSNFSSKGMSGGPVITQGGKLVGMVCSGFDSQKSNTQPELVNAGFFPLDMKQMDKFWSSLNLAQDTQQTSTILN